MYISNLVFILMSNKEVARYKGNSNIKDFLAYFKKCLN